MVGTALSTFSWFSMARGLFKESYWILSNCTCIRAPIDGGFFVNDMRTAGFEEAKKQCGTSLTPVKKWIIS
jgi:hypothetical protein